jgi:hypothetical protein
MAQLSLVHKSANQWRRRLNFIWDKAVSTNLRLNINIWSIVNIVAVLYMIQWEKLLYSSCRISEIGSITRE